VTIIVIGGCAGVGKTTLSQALAERLSLPTIVHVDDLREAHDGEHGESFIDATPEVWTRDVRWLCESLIASTRLLHRSITATIEGLLATDGDGIVEGEGIEPAVVEHGREVRPVYIIEDDAERLHATFAARPSRARFLRLAASEQAAVVQMNRLYSIWLRSEAERHGQPWVVAHPWSTLADRTLVEVLR
jgi:hypothetical protein